MNKVQIEDATCVICRDGITNPICPECLAKEMTGWRPELRSILLSPDRGEYTVKCMFCGKGMSICAHCYSHDIYDLVGEKYPELAEEFMDTFGLREDTIP